MQKKIAFIAFTILISASLVAKPKKLPQPSTRQLWLQYMDRTARPVIENLAKDSLKMKMPVVLSEKIDNPTHRAKVAYLEAFARTLCGISPWMNQEGGNEDEIKLRNQYREWTLKAIANATDPNAKDYLQWTGGQPLVDASFFALALVRCPWVWEHLDAQVKQNVVTALISSRSTIPVYTNWILFSGMVEAFLCKYNYDYDAVRMEYGIREFSQHWYVGDGMYSDGMNFAMDYYNSYVIQPYLNNMIEAVSPRNKSFDWYLPKLDKITKRYAEIQERQIAPDGTFPVTGRSIVYRGGVFHHLADMALRKKLPSSLSPSQVRCALTAVIHKTLSPPKTFNDQGWLNIGLAGHQPDLADFYINTGSLYLTCSIFLPLGLTESDPFWSDPDESWTSVKVWEGKDMEGDHALHKL